AEAVRLAEDVYFGYLPVADRERHDGERLSFEHANQPSGAVDEHREPNQTKEREAQGATSHLLRAADLDGSACMCSGIDSQDHLRVEDSDEALEVTILRSRDKSVDNASLSFHTGVRSGPARLNAAARAAGELASR